MKEKRKGIKPALKTGLKMGEISVLTDGHRDMIRCFLNGDITLGLGCAGTGKTFMAVALALREIFRPESPFSHIILVRSTVPVRGVGFLPGTEQEKCAPYERSFIACVNEIMGRGDAYHVLKDHGAIEFHSTGHEQGLTYRDAIVIIDEAENLNFKELDLITSRLGENCKLFIIGDLAQDYVTSRSEQSGLRQYLKIMDYMADDEEGGVGVVWFREEDIVRGELVRRYIIAKNRVLDAAA